MLVNPAYVNALNNIGALQARAGLGRVNNIGGKTTICDGGEGSFQLDPSDMATPDNGITVVIDAANQRWKRVYTGGIAASWFGIPFDGVTECSALLNAAATFCAARGVPCVLDKSGTILTKQLAQFPAGFKGFVTASGVKVEFEIDATDYTNTRPIFYSLNEPNVEFTGFTINTDDAALADCFALACQGGSGRISGVRVYGKCNYGIFTRDGDYYVDDSEFEGTANTLAQIGIYGMDCNNTLFVRSRSFGVNSYGISQGGGSNNHVLNCNVEESGQGFGPSEEGFGISQGGVTGGSILGCRTLNTKKEGVQFTDCKGFIGALNSVKWEGNNGDDMGISVNGMPATGSIVGAILNNYIENSFASGVGLADHTQEILVANNFGKDWAVRGTAAGSSGTGIASIACVSYQDAASVCKNNRFQNNKCQNSGPVTYAFLELAVIGSCENNADIYNDINNYTNLFAYEAGSGSYGYDLVAHDYTPTIVGGGGLAGSFAYANYKRQGPQTLVTFCYNVGVVGVGAGFVTISTPSGLSAQSNGGALAGIYTVTGAPRSCIGAASGTDIYIFDYMGSYPLAVAGHALIGSITYNNAN